VDDALIMQILSDWNFWGEFKENLRERSAYSLRAQQLFSPRTATIFLGVRRAGKSSLAYLFLKRLIDAGEIREKNSLIINFEDPRFPPNLNASDLHRIFEVYSKSASPDPSNLAVVLDEAQAVENWEKFARFLLEAKKARVVITGSSSGLLATELSAALAGRHVDVEVFPLDFKEFLEFRGFSNAFANKIVSTKNRFELQRFFAEYLGWGGFPEVVLSPSEPRKRELLQRYFEDILMKDVVKRFGVKQVAKLENLASVLLANISTPQSFNKLKQKTGLSLDSVERFCGFLESARLFFFLKKFDYSVGAQVLAPRKVFVSDHGFYSVKGFRFSENYGRVTENVAALELFRRRASNPRLEVFYWRDYEGREVDFVVKEGAAVKQLVQVTAANSFDEVGGRETRSLLAASNELKCGNLLVLTKDLEGERRVKGTRVRFTPLWKWLLA
jgi:predicted AAA+ superfamily ATPase